MRNPLSKKIVEIQPSGIRKFFDVANEMKDAISLGVGEPDFDTPWRIREEGIFSLEKGLIAYIKSCGLRCEVGPFETTIEGDSYAQLMDIVKECQHVAVRAGAEKVSAYIKVVYQPEGQILTIDQKITKHR